MAKKDVQVNVRLPAELLELLRDAAERRGRSLTAEIATRLQESFPETLHALQLDELLNRLYVTQSLEFSLRIRLDKASVGSSEYNDIEEELRAVQDEIDRLNNARDDIISKHDKKRQTRLHRWD